MKKRQIFYYLIDCELRNKQFPDSFFLPEHNEIASIKPGDCVQLIFNDKERMWVQVTHRDKDNFEGTLSSFPLIIDTVQFGDIITFKTKYICQVEDKEFTKRHIEKVKEQIRIDEAIKARRKNKT